MELKLDKALLEAVEEQIDVHFGGNQENWEGIVRAVAACFPAGVRRRIERAEGCTFSEWLDETLYKWDGRSLSTLLPLLQKRTEKIA
ncbi:MAG TPA: hypothetical protein VG389_11170 [Myxococcota bacterium]|jgi:hypothetical protein|nr:hypothetical protein [Myxococcota bacterium]